MAVRFVYFCKGVRGEVCLRALLDAGFVPCAVVNPADSYRSQIEALCSDAGVELIEGDHPNEPTLVARLEALGADVFIMAGYNRILREPVLALPRLGVINLHGGKLPEYRGAAPINWQIMRGETELGCTILYADAGIDTGDIIAEASYTLTAEQDAGDAVSRSLELFAPMLVEVMRTLASGQVLPTVKQDLEAGATFGRRFPEDSQIDWRHMTAEQAVNFVRALADPYPNAFSWVQRDGRAVMLRITRASLPARTWVGKPGRVLAKQGKAVLIGCSDRAVAVELVRLGEGAEQVLSAAEVLTLYEQLGR